MRGISFDIEEKDRLMDEARKLAVQDGHAKAELLANEAGVELGKVLSISEGGSRGPIMQARGMAEMAAVPIAEGEQTISASVALTYEIE